MSEIQPVQKMDILEAENFVLRNLLGDKPPRYMTAWYFYQDAYVEAIWDIRACQLAEQRMRFFAKYKGYACEPVPGCQPGKEEYLFPQFAWEEALDLELFEGLGDETKTNLDDPRLKEEYGRVTAEEVEELIHGGDVQ